MDQIRVLVAAEWSLVRAGLKAVLAPQNDITVVGETSDCVQAAARARDSSASMIVLCILGTGTNNSDALHVLRSNSLGVSILLLSAHDDPEYVQQAMISGANGFALFRSTADELVRAVRVIARGGTYLDPSITFDVFKCLRQQPASHCLSCRESAVLRRVALGFANKQIAADLEISVKTVETYKARSMNKLRLRSRAEVVRFASRAGWLAEC